MGHLFRRLVCCLMLGVLPVGEALAQMVVVVNARTGVAVMSRAEIANIFLGRTRQFFNGHEAFPVDLPDEHPERVAFYRRLLGRDISEINTYWSRQILSGQARPPRPFKTPEQALAWVASQPGGIAFTELSRVDARVRVVYEFKH